jgi:hypothetical protein
MTCCTEANAEHRISSVATRGFIGNLSDRGQLAEALVLSLEKIRVAPCRSSALGSLATVQSGRSASRVIRCSACCSKSGVSPLRKGCTDGLSRNPQHVLFPKPNVWRFPLVLASRSAMSLPSASSVELSVHPARVEGSPEAIALVPNLGTVSANHRAERQGKRSRGLG